MPIKSTDETFNTPEYKAGYAQGIKDAVEAVEGCGMSPDNDLECAFQDGIISCAYAVEALSQGEQS